LAYLDSYLNFSRFRAFKLLRHNIKIFADSVGNILESLFFGSSLGNAAWQPRDPDTDSFF